MKYLIGLDGSDLALDGLRHVLALSRQGLDCEVVLANVQPGANLYEVGGGARPRGAGRGEGPGRPARAGRRCRAVRRSRPAVRTGAGRRRGRAAADRPGRRQRLCDAIVLGARGLGESGLSSFGRVAEGVLHRAHVPVTLVRRPPPEVEPSDLPPDDEV